MNYRMATETTTEAKTRMLSVRLSEKEYIHCRELCTAHGISTVSEFARAAINLLFGNSQQLSSIQQDERISKLERRVQMLSLEIVQLRNANAHTSGQTPEHTNSAGSNHSPIGY
jgi:hypothetical protein